MADLGDLLGSLMSGLIHARRMADEQTAALAEYYKENPLLESLSVPRIRIPELSIEVPLLIENHIEGETGEVEDPQKIAAAAETQLKSTASSSNIKINQAFHKTFAEEIKKRLESTKRTGIPIMKETVVRNVQDAFAATITKSNTLLTATEKEAIARDLRDRISAVSIIKKPVASSIIANIKTADIKDKASSTSVVRLKITLKEEGLEWVTQSSESGGVSRTLQPE